MTMTSSRYRDFVSRPIAPRLSVTDRRPVGRVDPGAIPTSYHRRAAQAPARATWRNGGGSSSTRASIDGRQVVDAPPSTQTHIPASAKGVDPAAPVAGSTRSVGLSTIGGMASNGAMPAPSRRGPARSRLVAGERLGIVVLGNAFPTGVPEASLASFLDTVFPATRPDWVARRNGFFDASLG